VSSLSDDTTPKQEKSKKSNGSAFPAGLHVVSPDQFSPDDPYWTSELLKDHEYALPILANAIIALDHAPEWQGVLGFDENSKTVIVREPPPWTGDSGFAWTDADTVRAMNWLQRQSDEHLRLVVPKETVHDAVNHVARLHPFHPIKEYLEHEPWDGERRLDCWLYLYLGVTPTDYTTAISRCFLISAVARIYQPGCQVDTCLILEGGQGTFKSTALRRLFHPWFTDQMPDIRTKDASIQLAGVWLAEFSDLSVFKESNREHLKAFLSRSTDRFRPVRGRYSIDMPRQNVFAGTTNEQYWHGDETGARRFWPVKIGTIDIPALDRDRDQLWAEALVEYRKGSRWHLTIGEEVLAAEEQEARRQADVWEAPIALYLSGQLETSVREILKFFIKRDIGDWNRWDETRVSRCLQSLGWIKYRKRTGLVLEWKYRPGSCPIDDE